MDGEGEVELAEVAMMGVEVNKVAERVVEGVVEEVVERVVEKAADMRDRTGVERPVAKKPCRSFGTARNSREPESRMHDKSSSEPSPNLL